MTPRGPLGSEELVDAALAEDVGDGDRTVAWTVPEGATGRAVILSRARGVIYGADVARSVFRRVDPSVHIGIRIADGDAVERDDVVLEVSGRLASILTAERTALNFLGRLSGVATAARQYVSAVEGTGCRIADTRKTTPGWRALEKAAAAAGGAMSHRAGLYDMVLIKDNHIRSAGGVSKALAAALPSARDQGIEVEIEVTDLDELREALAAGPDRIMLDNMSPDVLRDAVNIVRRSGDDAPLLEASGGIDLESVRRVAETGVDYISVGAITHSAPTLDLSLQVVER